MIVYNKYKDYILTIEATPDNLFVEDEYAKLIKDDEIFFDEITIIKINNLLNEEFDKIDDFKLNIKYCLHEIKNENFYKIFFENYNDAFCHKFVTKQQYNLFPNGYSGFIKEFYTDTDIYFDYIDNNAKIKCEYFHVNGKIEGKYKEYDTTGKLIKDIDYVDGLINGFHKSFDSEYNYRIDEYHNGILHGKSIEYFKDKISDIRYYDNGQLETFTSYYFNSEQIMEEQKIIDGEKICIKYDRDGKITMKHSFTNGKYKQIFKA